MTALLTMVGCAGPGPEPSPGTSGSPNTMPSTQFRVQALMRDGEPVEIGEGTDVDLPDTPTGGTIMPHGVCNARLQTPRHLASHDSADWSPSCGD